MRRMNGNFYNFLLKNSDNSKFIISANYRIIFLQATEMMKRILAKKSSVQKLHISK